MDMPKLTEHHEKLYALIGDWEGTETLAETPWASAGTATGKLHIRSDLDGFFVASSLSVGGSGAAAQHLAHACAAFAHLVAG